MVKVHGSGDVGIEKLMRDWDAFLQEDSGITEQVNKNKKTFEKGL